MWFEPCTLIEVNEHLSNHGCQLSNYLLTMILDTDCCRVTTRMSIHTSNQLYMKRITLFIIIKLVMYVCSIETKTVK